jgi:hypothetical protein
LISGFPEGADFYATVEVDTNFGLGVKGAEVKAGKVFAECLLVFAEINVIFLYACC